MITSIEQKHFQRENDVTWLQYINIAFLECDSAYCQPEEYTVDRGFSRGWQYITKVDNMHYHTQGMQYLFYYTEPILIEFIWYLQFYM